MEHLKIQRTPCRDKERRTMRKLPTEKIDKSIILIMEDLRTRCVSAGKSLKLIRF